MPNLPLFELNECTHMLFLFFSAGLKKCLRGGLVGFGVAAVICAWTGKDRIKQLMDNDRY